MNNPINAVAAIAGDIGGEEIFLGTGFAFLSPNFILTASHLFSEPVNPIKVVFPYVNKVLIPTKIAHHEYFDIAALACSEIHINNRDVTGVEFFQAFRNDQVLGTDFLTYGYPEDVSFGKTSSPTPRLFKGYIQRYFSHNSHLNFKYPAAELSIPCPKGLSGAPVMMLEDVSTIIGMVTESIEVTTEIHEEEIERRNDSESRNIYRRVTNFGVAARVSTIEDWVIEHYKVWNT